jgi:hypothetical protein
MSYILSERVLGSDGVFGLPMNEQLLHTESVRYWGFWGMWLSFQHRMISILVAGILVSALSLTTACVSSDDGFAEQSTSKKSFGEIVYGVVEYNLAQTQSCQAPLIDELRGHRTDVITSLNSSVPPALLEQIQKLMQDAIFPAIDSGELEATTDNMADLLGLLTDPVTDPHRNTLRALLNLAQTRTILTQTQVLDLVDAAIYDRDLKNVTHALAQLAQHHDGVDYTINSATDLLSRQLVSFTEENLCEGLNLGDIEETLLKSDVLSTDAQMGNPAWAVLADTHGNPRVRINPNTGSLFLPFIDIDADGAADVNQDGVPVTSSGSPIDIPAMGSGVDRDEVGRAINDAGQLLYEYYDAKRSGLAMMLVLVKEALEDNMHQDLATVVNTTIPTIEICDDGTSTCRKYPSDDNPFADIAWMLVELSRFDDAAVFLRTWSTLIKDNPELAETIMVALGQVLESVESSSVDLTDPKIPALLGKALPLLDEVFEADNSSGKSTAQLLLELIHDLGGTARTFPEQLLDTIDYIELSKSPSCTDAKPNYDLSTPVDYSQPRYFQSGGGWVDNRSSIEESIELLSAVDCGSIPFTGGQTVAEFVIELLASRDEESVCGIIDLLLGTIDTFGFLGEFATVFSLDMIGCDGDDVFPRLEALDSLASSGALNGYLPIAQVFVERNQLSTLLDIFHLAADDLRLDDDSDANTESAIREALPIIGQTIRAGAVDPMLDLADLLVTTEAVDENGTVGDVIMNSIERMVDDDGSVQSRQGLVSGSSLAEQILQPFQTIVERLGAADNTEPMKRLLEHVTGYLTETEVDDGQTVDTADDRVVLSNPRFIPLTTIVLDFVAQLLELPDGQQTCYFNILQNDIDGFLTGRNFATMVRLIQAIENAPGASTLESFLIRALDPQATDADREIFGPAVVIMGGLLQAQIDVNDMESIMTYLSLALDPNRTDSRMIVSTFDNMLTRDSEDVLLSAIRNLLNRDILETGKAPLQELGSTFIDVASVDTSNSCEPRDELSLDEAAELVDTVVTFMEDDQEGLGAIYELLGMRRR